MIGPVSIDYPDFRNSRISVFTFSFYLRTKLTTIRLRSSLLAVLQPVLAVPSETRFQEEAMYILLCVLLVQLTRSSGALPFCTSAPQLSKDSVVWDLEEPVAPPQPSRPVFPPKRNCGGRSKGKSIFKDFLER